MFLSFVIPTKCNKPVKVAYNIMFEIYIVYTSLYKNHINICTLNWQQHAYRFEYKQLNLLI